MKRPKEIKSLFEDGFMPDEHFMEFVAEHISEYLNDEYGGVGEDGEHYVCDYGFDITIKNIGWEKVA